MTSSEGEFDPTISGQEVRHRRRPTERGLTTGKIKGDINDPDSLMVEVNFEHERKYVHYILLELAEQDDDIENLLVEGRFGKPEDVQRKFIFEKIRGDLTNIFYSMESGNTMFYPHQFKPVAKFIESPIESAPRRLLIADEVGLGKTIEATYIWKELQARGLGRRLLIICPSFLQEKWKLELRDGFNISAEIVKAEDIFDSVSAVGAGRRSTNFIYITSLQSIRLVENYKDEKDKSPRAQLRRLLESSVPDPEFSLFDLVVIDEAHHLRNSDTLSNKFGHLIKEASQHMLLLSATPLQTKGDNLYELMRLLDDEVFYAPSAFSDLIYANAPVVEALRNVWKSWKDSGYLKAAEDALKNARIDEHFPNDKRLPKIQEKISDLRKNEGKLPAEIRIEIARDLEDASLLSHYMVRSRKREVLKEEDRVIREPHSPSVEFGEEELRIYENITEIIREQMEGKKGAAAFTILSRQREMASSLAAALRGWKDRDIINTRETRYQDLGFISSQGQKNSEAEGTYFKEFCEKINWEKINLDNLERSDSKYRALLKAIKQILSDNREEKIVVFAYFRNTLSYLSRRLKADGFSAALIMGGMKTPKEDVIEEFRESKDIPILLSSEVGSEGIDLQFCRVIVNYDLPWNPMRVEQRIGRLDRLGQKAEQISIVNFFVKNTIEDEILSRLYDRVEIFKHSIGDLEEILGERSMELMVKLLGEKATEERRKEMAEQSFDALINRRKEQERLEEEAINLVGFEDYILSSIMETKQRRRWLQGREIFMLVEGFFLQKFPGTRIEEESRGDKEAPLIAKIKLSDKARTQLNIFVTDHKVATRTRLYSTTAPIRCSFDTPKINKLTRDMEVIDPTHPLVLWIRNHYKENPHEIFPVTAIRLKKDKVQDYDLDIATGDYVFLVQKWMLEGFRSERTLAYCATLIEGGEPLDRLQSEDLVVAALLHGHSYPNAKNLAGDRKQRERSLQTCMDTLELGISSKYKEFREKNIQFCEQQENSARKYAQRRIARMEETLNKLRSEGKQTVAATEGRIKMEEQRRDVKLHQIQKRKESERQDAQIVAGIIRVE